MDRDLAGWLAGLYPNPEVRAHMAEVTGNLAVWAQFKGRPEWTAWIDIHAALETSLAR